MLRNFLFYTIFLFCISHIAGSVTISGNVFSMNTHTPLPYVSVTDISSFETGTTTDKDGFFRLNIPDTSESVLKLRFSCVGFRDTIIRIQSKQDYIKVFLSERKYPLPAIVIQSSALSEQKIGISEGQILRDSNGDPLGVLPSKSAGFGFGVFVDLSEVKNGIVKSLDYYLLPKGKPQTPFILRFMIAEEAIRPNIMYPIEMFSDLVHEPIIVKGKAGWNTISLIDYNIPIQGKRFFILFTPIEGGDQYKWNDAEKEWYGMILGRYKKRKVKGLYWAVRAEETYSYDDTPFQRKINPAIVLRYLTDP